jgi:hypothetical protein
MSAHIIKELQYFSVMSVNDTILIDPSSKEIDKIIHQLKEHKLDVQDEGQMKDFLGVRI